MIAGFVGPMKFVAEVRAHVFGAVDLTERLTNLVGYWYSIVEEIDFGSCKGEGESTIVMSSGVKSSGCPFVGVAI